MKRTAFAIAFIAGLAAGFLFGPPLLAPGGTVVIGSQAHAKSARHSDTRMERDDRAHRDGHGARDRDRDWDRDPDRGHRGHRPGRGNGHGRGEGHKHGGHEHGGGHGGENDHGGDHGSGGHGGDGGSSGGGSGDDGDGPGGNDGNGGNGSGDDNPDDGGGGGGGGIGGNSGGDGSIGGVGNDGAGGSGSGNIGGGGVVEGEGPSGISQRGADWAAERRAIGSDDTGFGPETARAAIRASRRGSDSNPFAAIATATGPLGWSAPQPASAGDAPRIPLAVGDDAPAYRPLEITVLGLDQADRATLRRLGFEVITERRSRMLGNRSVSRLRTPAEMSTEAALMLARRRLPGVAMDFTHLYRPAQDIQRASHPQQPVPVAYGMELVGLFGGSSCPITTSIGLIDTDIARHPALADAPIRRRSFTNGGRTSVVHGTAIASMLVGELPGVVPLAGGAELYSASVFAFEGEALRSDVTAILAALDWMAARGVMVVNLSLMGPPNDLLERGVMAAAARGQILLAAAGNSGPGAPAAYPAGYAPVIAVAAVDARGRPYLRNNRGDYITISAPGVDIWGADARGGEAFWTGTSFAVPFALASVARSVAGGQVRDVNDARAALARAARDLGAPGHDPIFGYGLLRMEECS